MESKDAVASGASIKENLVRDILRYEAVKFGQFTLKSGAQSPIYVDIRICVSHPNFLSTIAAAVESVISEQDLKFDQLCGVPYTALPIATCISTRTLRPMVMRRKEMKLYGGRQIVEGRFRPGDKVLVVEDIVTTGSSVLDTVKVLEEVGLKVTDAVVLIDREQGGVEALREKNIRVHPVLKLTEIIDQLEKERLVDSAKAKEARNYIASVRPSLPSVRRPSFEERARTCAQPVARRLFEVATKKKSNLCVAVDVASSEKLLELADQLGPHICMLKTHIDLIEDFVYDKVIPPLKALACKHDFLLFEDRKFADIGVVAQLQYSKGVYRIVEWADLVTVHGVPGPAAIRALAEVATRAGGGQPRACAIVVEMSSEGALTSDDAYRKACAALAEAQPDFVAAAVGQRRVLNTDAMLLLTPGVHLDAPAGGDGLGQRYVGPRVAVAERGADIIIVGRGVTADKDPGAAAARYASAGWEAYVSSLTN